MTEHGKPSAAKINYNAVDLMKYLCAIFVTVLHMHLFENEAPALHFWLSSYLTRLAVPFFFISSGYFLFRKTVGTDSKGPVVKYVLKLLRIYLIWSAIYFIIVLKDNILAGGRISRNLLIWLRDLVFTGSYTHLWFLPALIFGVLAVSFLLGKGLSPRKIFLISLIFYLIGLTGQDLYGPVWGAFSDNYPAAWRVIYEIRWIIPTTRCGLFFGFPCVSAGLVLARSENTATLRKTFAFFCLSMTLWAAETKLTSDAGWCKANDMYAFLLPSAVLLFSVCLKLCLKNSPVYGELRESSMLIYYIHLFIYVPSKDFFEIIYGGRVNTVVRYLAVMAVTLLLVSAIKKLSRTKRFHWLSILYK